MLHISLSVLTNMLPANIKVVYNSTSSLVFIIYHMERLNKV